MFASLLTAPLLAAAALPQEEIVLVDGRVLEVQRITAETFSSVEYKTTGGSSGQKPADQVRELRHNIGARMLDEYAGALDYIAAEDYVAGIQVLNDVLADERLMSNSRYTWVKGDALFRQIRCMFSLADFEGVSLTVDRLLVEVPNTFYYAPALLAKADALRLGGDANAAAKAYEQLVSDVNTKSLPARWGKEAELAALLLDTSVTGETLRRNLNGIIAQVDGKFPTVASRAKVAIGDSYIAEENFTKARTYFTDIIDGGAADPGTEASAFFGMGLCDYRKGLLEEDQEAAVVAYFEANLNFLRVVAMYKDNVEMVPKSMFYSAMCFSRSGGGDNRGKALLIAGRLLKRFPNSQWTERAKTELQVR